MKYKQKHLHLPFLIVVILAIVECVFFFSTDFGKKSRVRIKDSIVQQAAISSLNKPSTNTKRYCLHLNLKNDPILIAEYKRIHEYVWTEITDGLAEVCIVDMEGE